MEIKRLARSDLLEVTRIQRECYSEEILESVDSFSAKLSAAPEFCFLAVKGELPVGYMIALPWMLGDIPDLDGVEYSVPIRADGLCIHDLAVSPAVRSAGVANQLLEAVLDTARERGYKRVFLVAIQGASTYWQRHGFKVVQGDEALRRDLSAYGEDAVYMVRIDEGA